MEYKPTYTKEEITELVNWFETHTYEKELRLEGGLYIKDLDVTIPAMLHVSQKKYENKTFSGQIYQLFRIREALQSSASTRLVKST